MHPSDPRNDDAHLWNRNGQFSWTCWHRYIYWQHSMGISLNMPQSIKSLTRSSYIWTRHDLRHSVHSWLETIGEYRLHQTDRSNKRENSPRVDYDYTVGDKVLIRKDGILRKAESIWRNEPWTITTVHTSETIRIQCGTKSERINK